MNARITTLADAAQHIAGLATIYLETTRATLDEALDAAIKTVDGQVAAAVRGPITTSEREQWRILNSVAQDVRDRLTERPSLGNVRDYVMSAMQGEGGQR